MLENITKRITTNPLDETEFKDFGELIYSEDDKKYLDFLQERLENAKRQKDRPRPEFNNKTYYQYYEDNEKIANTYHLGKKKNDDDVIVSAGTVETKLDSLLSNINNLNLKSEVFAFDKNNNRITELGNALEDIIHDTEIRDGADGAGDEEKKPLRQRELLKQGTVFVQEEWVKKWEIKKRLKKKYNGEFKDFEGWTKTLEKVFEGPTRTLLYGPNVYLGDMTEFYMENQPFIFVSIIQDYNNAKKKFGKFTNWQYVKPGKVSSEVEDAEKTIFNNQWRLTELSENQVEILLYQDQPNDEFQIIINGVMMLPIGFPLSAVSPRGVYNIAKQVFRVLSDKFAYGGSFVSSGSVKEISNLVDEMLKLFVLKTRKSISPAYTNMSGRVIDKKVLSPGRISMGIDSDVLKPIAGGETQGITAGELGVMKELQDLINKSTVSEQFTGQQGKSGTTATEVLEVQRQARLTLGLTIASCTLLEKKLSYLRLYNILENWFDPTGTRIEEINGARKVLNVFRKTNREVSIEGEGLGERMVIPTDKDLPSPEEIRASEIEEEKIKGFPVRKLFLKTDSLRDASLFWYITVNPKEKESSAFFKLMFKEKLNDMITLMNFGSVPNKDGLEEEYSRVYGESRSKMFQKGQVSPELTGIPPKERVGRAAQSGVPELPANLGLSG